MGEPRNEMPSIVTPEEHYDALEKIEQLESRLREAEAERDLMERANETSMKLADDLAGDVERLEVELQEAAQAVESARDLLALAVKDMHPHIEPHPNIEGAIEALNAWLRSRVALDVSGA